MTTIPEMCLEFTQVFRTLKLEMGIAVIAGLLIGVWIGKTWRDCE
jgi:hypothetical protein